MIGESLPKAIGSALDGSYGAIAGTDSPGMKTFSAMAKEAGFDGTSPYTPEAYDAAALLAFAMQAAKSTKSADFKSKVMDVANAPGEKIFPGELAKGLKIIADGGDIDYVGASAVELVGGGESAGNYREIVVKDEQNVTVGFR
jgi:branched-chain amino acid transport system substrate-binding protein